MSQVRKQNPYVQAIDEDDGSVIAVDSAGYCTLTVDTFLFPLGLVSDAHTFAVEIMTDAAIAGTFSLECCCLPRGPDNAPPDQRMTDWDTSATSGWAKDDSTTNAHVMTNGTGWTPTNLTLVKTAGVGIAIYNMALRGAFRYRCRAVITTGGLVRVSAGGKD